MSTATAPVLAPTHIAYLQARGITEATIIANGLESARPQDLARLAGGPVPDGHSGLLIPYEGCNGFARVRLFPSIVRGNGREQKFGQPAGSPVRLYVPAGVREVLMDPDRAISIIEGEIKALALTQGGFPTTAIGGVWNFRTKDLPLDGIIPDLEAVPWQGRAVYLVPDSDAWENEQVLLAVFRLAHALEGRQAVIFIVKIPAGEQRAKQGADDFLAAVAGLGKDPAAAWRRLVEKALTLGHAAFKPFRRAEKAKARAAAREASKAQEERELTEAEIADLAKLAAPILDAPDPLALATEAIRAQGYGGDIRHALIAYLAATSRVLAMRPGSMPVHLLLLGVPGAGKSFTLKVVLRLLPPHAFHEIEAGSPRALIYDEAPTRHRALIFGEADSLPAGEDNPAASAVRNLLQEHRLRYTVVERDPETGRFCTREVVKEGPSVLITTAVRRLGDQMDSRVFSLEAKDDPEQIRAALDAQATAELWGTPEPEPSLIAFQALLQAQAPWDVVVPYVRSLSTAMGKGVVAPRLQRDFARLLSLVKAVAVLRHRQRQRDTRGRLVATLEDYATVRELVADMYEATAGASRAVRQAVGAVQALHQPNRPVSVTAVAKHLAIGKMAASRRVRAALKGGWLLNGETRKGHPAALEPGEPLPEETGLPSMEAIQGCNTVTPLTDGRWQDEPAWEEEISV